MKKHLFVLAILAALLLVLSGCDITISGSGPGGSFGIITPTGALTGSTGSASLGKQTKTSGCVVHGGLPDSACTPGAIFTNATVQQICTPGYASSVRNVPFSEADQAYAEYGIYHHYSGQYEVDHLVPLELGGSNDIANLWPEAANPTPGFHQKDQVENYLHDQVCSGTMSLKEAQTEIATNWIAVYNRMPANYGA
ncbi:MAG TPA: HNH endonuclease signature motif containing protein [Ktedonobacteraceae bacterium]|nr:HNH endonuclease signature motif containing protein [Ktedonobacteraceae bacterium]